MKKYFTLILLLLLLMSITGCKENATKEKNVYKKITAQEAKAIIDEQSGYIILDVRTESEFAQGYIYGAILIPDYEIATRIEEEIPDKNKLILVYCRSGRRSAIAAKEMIEMGYSNVLDFGGIIDWPYDLIK